MENACYLSMGEAQRGKGDGWQALDTMDGVVIFVVDETLNAYGENK
jgi:hypothetical protein